MPGTAVPLCIKVKERQGDTEKEEEVFFSQGGVPVYFFPGENLHSFCLCLYVRAGSMFESEKENGATHFLEHLVFRNINHQMGGNLYKELDRMGLAFEGVTYREFVQFSVTGAPKHLGEAIGLLVRILAPLSLPAKEVALERGRVKAEIREDGEKATLDYFTDRIVFGNTSLSRTIPGTAAGLDKMSLSFLRDFQKKMFSAANLFFCLTGCAAREDALSLCRALDAYPLEKTLPKRENIAPVCPAMFHRDATVAVKNGKRCTVRLSADVDMTQISDAELTLLYDILFGDGEESRLHQVLSERTGYIYSFRASLETYRNIAVVSILYEIPQKRLEESVALLTGVLAEAKNTVGDALRYVKAPYTDNAGFVLDDAADLNWNSAYEKRILELPYRTIAERAETYQGVTAEAVSRAAREIFRPQNLTLTVKGDARRIHTAALRNILLMLGENEKKECPTGEKKK